MNGIGEGICGYLGSGCKGEYDVEHWKSQVKYFNMFPELIRMTCTAIGAWGKAVKNQSGRDHNLLTHSFTHSLTHSLSQAYCKLERLILALVHGATTLSCMCIRIIMMPTLIRL